MFGRALNQFNTLIWPAFIQLSSIVVVVVDFVVLAENCSIRTGEMGANIFFLNPTAARHCCWCLRFIRWVPLSQDQGHCGLEAARVGAIFSPLRAHFSSHSPHSMNHSGCFACPFTRSDWLINDFAPVSLACRIASPARPLSSRAATRSESSLGERSQELHTAAPAIVCRHSSPLVCAIFNQINLKIGSRLQNNQRTTPKVSSSATLLSLPIRMLTV